MVLQLLHVAEAVAAVGALQRQLLAVVYELVSLQVLDAAEALAARLAAVRPLARVDALVALQVPQAAEGAAALRAAVRPLARVHQVVALQRARVREALAADLAAVRPLGGAGALVVLEGPGVAECVAAVGAGEEVVLAGASAALQLRAAQRARVLLQLGLRGEAPAALWAEVEQVPAALLLPNAAVHAARAGQHGQVLRLAHLTAVLPAHGRVALSRPLGSS